MKILGIIWRAIWIVPIYISLIITTILVLVSYGVDQAVWFWERNV